MGLILLNALRERAIPGSPYSCRSATAGSTRNARAVGATVARPATSESTQATATKFTGSAGRTTHSGRHQSEALAGDHRENVAWRRTQRDPNADLVNPLLDG